jgi:DNA-binding IclR family transcriptional regulator
MPRANEPLAGPAIKSAARTLEVLEFFSARQQPATVGEIAAALGLPQSSTSMLLKSLVSLNYLDYRPATRRFVPTYRVTLLGSWIKVVDDAHAALTDLMEAIHRDTGETVMLGMQHGASMRYVHILGASYAVQLAVAVGTVRPMTLSAIGQMLLAAKPDAEIRAIARRNNADVAEGQRVRESEFMAEIRLVRARGYAESLGRMTAGANVIAMLAPTEGGGPAMAIGVGGPSERIAQARDTIITALGRHLRRPCAKDSTP